MPCLITGCVAFNGFMYASGDLHQIGDCYVFNACFDETHDTLWQGRPAAHHATKIIDFSRAPDYWERRATLIAPMAQVGLNDAAWEYIERGKRL